MKLRIEIDTTDLPSMGTPVGKRDTEGCPIETKDAGLNQENKETAMAEHQYGPLKSDVMDDSEEHCGNCAAFDKTSKMAECIANGGTGVLDPEKGFCHSLKFTCSEYAWCDAWVQGGPITDDSFDHGDVL